MKNVALALSSGGPRGFAYIGAIEVLQERGYRITSVAGSSAGALVGGIFAAGGLEPFKEWLCGLDPVQVVSLMDFAPSRNSLVKGDKITCEKHVAEVAKAVGGSIAVKGYIRFLTGEGIEKKADDFAAEVASMVK